MQSLSEQQKNIKEISEAINSLNSDEIDLFLQEILTESELNGIIKRWIILKELYLGKTQRTLAKEQHISLCKITRGAKIIKDKSTISYKILNKISSDNI